MERALIDRLSLCVFDVSHFSQAWLRYMQFVRICFQMMPTFFFIIIYTIIFIQVRGSGIQARGFDNKLTTKLTITKNFDIDSKIDNDKKVWNWQNLQWKVALTLTIKLTITRNFVDNRNFIDNRIDNNKKVWDWQWQEIST